MGDAAEKAWRIAGLAQENSGKAPQASTVYALTSITYALLAVAEALEPPVEGAPAQEGADGGA